MSKVLSEYKYSNAEIVNTLKLLSPRKTDKTPIRIGNEIDGGYILLKELIKDNGVTYSFGVGHTNLFEQEMTKKYNHTNYMYDHTLIPKFVKRIPKTKNFVFKPIGVGSKNTEDLRTIPTMIEDNGHQNEKDMILQCDIEGAEWDIFKGISQDTLKQFAQIIIEFHSLDKCIKDLDFFKRGKMEHWRYAPMKETLNILRQNFTPYHVHGNNHRGTFIFEGVTVPEVLEVSYVRNDLVNFKDEQQSFPTELDRPNMKGAPDHQLGNFQWT